MTISQNGRGQTDTSKLKLGIVIGSIFATLVGGEMVAKQDQFVTSTPLATTSILMQQNDNGFIVVNNAPIAQLVVPSPVTRSRSSG